MATRTKVKAAAVYCRISMDRAGEGLGVARQERLCRELAERLGWSVAEVYTDNDRPSNGRAPRPAYDRMVADLEAGRRDGVLCVDLDRLTRRPIELEKFIDLADARGVALANVSGDVDLSTSNGRMYARVLGAVARQETEHKAERVSREAAQAARRGVPRGSRRPFGYEDDKVTVRPEEAELVREAVARVLAGETVPAVARDWNRRGIPTPQGAAHGWSASTVVSILRNPRLCGLRAYKGEIVSEGQWEPIIDRPTWEALQGRIRRTARPGRPSTHLLSGILRCGRCSSPLWTSWRKMRNGDRVPRYACIRRPGHSGCGKTTVVAAPLDDLIRDAVINSLAGRHLAKARKQRASRDGEERAAARELADAERRLEELAGDFADGTIGRREWLAARERLEKRIAEASRTLDRNRGPLADLPSDADALREAWDAGTVEWRRAVVGTVIERVTVAPAARARAKFDPDRVDITWRV